MEFSLHQQLKQHYADSDADTEVVFDGYRIDAIREDVLVEVQASSLSAIRDKIQSLVRSNRLIVVKPLIGKKWIIKQDKKGGETISRRLSPKKESFVSLFEELVYLTRTFPHPNLTLDIPIVSVEELRFPGHGRRRRRRENDFVVEDQRLVSIEEQTTLASAGDLLGLLPVQRLPKVFGTAEIAKAADCSRWIAQKIAYCLREMGAVQNVGKKGNAMLYECSAN